MPWELWDNRKWLVYTRNDVFNQQIWKIVKCSVIYTMKLHSDMYVNATQSAPDHGTHKKSFNFGI